MEILQSFHVKSKAHGEAPSSRRHDQADVVSLPTTPKQRHQQAAQRGDGEAARLFKTRLPVLVDGLHALGVRPVGELLIELVGHDEQARNNLLLLLERYNRLNPAVVSAVGGDIFPAVVFPVESK